MLEVIRNTDRQSLAIIREIYESGKSGEDFEKELDVALSQSISIIIIEPENLGENAWKWIYVGDLIRQKALLSSLLCICPAVLINFNYFAKEKIWRIFLTGSAIFGALTSIGCSLIYSVFWQRDNCCNYQVEKNEKRLDKLIPFSKFISSNYIVIVYKEDFSRKIFHWSASLISVGICSGLIYKVLL